MKIFGFKSKIVKHKAIMLNKEEEQLSSPQIKQGSLCMSTQVITRIKHKNLSHRTDKLDRHLINSIKFLVNESHPIILFCCLMELEAGMNGILQINNNNKLKENKS